MSCDLLWVEDPLPMPDLVFVPATEPPCVPRPMRRPAKAWLVSRQRAATVARILDGVKKLRCQCKGRRTCVRCQAHTLRKRDQQARGSR